MARGAHRNIICAKKLWSKKVEIPAFWEYLNFEQLFKSAWLGMSYENLDKNSILKMENGSFDKP